MCCVTQRNCDIAVITYAKQVAYLFVWKNGKLHIFFWRNGQFNLLLPRLWTFFCLLIFTERFKLSWALHFKELLHFIHEFLWFFLSRFLYRLSFFCFQSLYFLIWIVSGIMCLHVCLHWCSNIQTVCVRIYQNGPFCWTLVLFAGFDWMLAVANLCYALASRIMRTRFLLHRHHHTSPSTSWCTIQCLLRAYNLTYYGFSSELIWLIDFTLTSRVGALMIHGIGLIALFTLLLLFDDGPWNWADSFVYTSLVIWLLFREMLSFMKPMNPCLIIWP